MIINTNGDGGISKKLIWENATPNSSFAGQILTLPANGYDYLEIEYYYATSDASRFFGTCVNGRATHSFVESAHTGETYVVSRNVDWNGNSVTINNAFAKWLGSKSAPSAENVYLIPVKIYGVKGVQ